MKYSNLLKKATSFSKLTKSGSDWNTEFSKNAEAWINGILAQWKSLPKDISGTITVSVKMLDKLEVKVRIMEIFRNGTPISNQIEKDKLREQLEPLALSTISKYLDQDITQLAGDTKVSKSAINYVGNFKFPV